MNQEKYFSVENGRDVMIDRFHDQRAAIDFAERNSKAKEIFAYTKNDELIGCVWSRKEEQVQHKIKKEVQDGK